MPSTTTLLRSAAWSCALWAAIAFAPAPRRESHRSSRDAHASGGRKGRATDSRDAKRAAGMAGQLVDDKPFFERNSRIFT